MRKNGIRSVFRIAVATVMCISLLLPAAPISAASGGMKQNATEIETSIMPEALEQYDSIDGLSGDILYDTSGKRVMTCGGEVHQFTENGVTKWYWFGVDDLDKADGQQKEEGIHLYSSSDLYNWDYEGIIWNIDDAAHPKVLYDKVQKQYVMWVSAGAGVVVGTSSSIKGPFTPVSASGADDIMGFFNLFEESPGTAYVIYPNFSSFSENSYYIAQLSSDYKSIEGTPQALQFGGASLVNAEGGIFKKDGKYYLVNAGMTQYAVANSLTGTWTVRELQMWDGTSYKTIVDKNQTSNVFHVKTENTDKYVCVGDSVGEETEEVRYIWLPIEFFGDGTIALRELSNWKLDAIVPGDSEEPAVYDSIPGLADKELYDTEGREVMAFGGEIHQVEENGETKWYWFGEDMPKSYIAGDNNVNGLHLYSSTDLYNWTREEDIFKGMDSKEQFETDAYFKALYGDLSDSEKNTVFECLRYCPTAHPKVLYNEKEHQYVMWVPEFNGKQCIATSDSIKGPFKFVKYCESVTGFVTMYKESTGKVYVVYESEHGLSMTRLTDDYMDVEDTSWTLKYNGDTELSSAQGGMFKQNGKYYIVNAVDSDERSPQYAVADSLTGTWTVHPLRIYNDEEQTFEDGTGILNPTSAILQINTESGVSYINISDSLGYDTQDKRRYVWLPIKFLENDTIALRKLSNWKLEDSEPEKPDISEEPDIPEEPKNYDTIDGLSGEVLYDTEGERVYACGGEVHQVEENGKTKWYWFGVNDLEIDGQKKHPGIHLYSSTDLYNWKHEGTMGEFGNGISIAHPKVLYNEQQQQYVMWVELDTGGMSVATSKSIKGPFTILEGAGASDISGFINLYKDSDGKAYIIYGYRNSMMPEDTSLGMRLEGDGLFIAKLSDDYTTIEGTPQPFQYTDSDTLFNSEGGIFERNGKYYMVNAGNPDQDGPQYAVADSLNGPWTVHKMRMWNNEKQEFEEIVKKNQTSNVFHVKTKTADTYVCVGDSVGDEDPEIVRYIWLPIKFFEDETIALEKLSNWKLDVGNTDVDIAVTEVKLSETRKTMKVGDKYQIGATVLPENATDKTLSYESSDASVASVSGTGQVEAKKAGNVTVTVTSANGKVAELKVTVESVVEKPPVEVILVRLAETSKTLKVGEKYQIGSIVFPANATNKTLSYKSSDDSVVSVSGTGQIEAKKAGNAKITVTSVNGKKAELKVTVEKPLVEVTDVKLSETSKTLKVGDKYQIGATVLPADATNKTLSYESSDNSVASVSGTGQVKAKKTGNARVIVTSANGKTAELKVTVTKKPDVQKVLVSTNKMTVGIGEKVQLEATVYPENVSNNKLTYKTSNNKVKVGKDGKITAQKTGTCKITISSSNNKKAVVNVTVKKKPGKISLNAKKITLKVGKKFQIKPKLPNDTASYKITYTSSKKSVATVSKTGKVTAKKKGNTVITVKTYNGKKATLKIHVK